MIVVLIIYISYDLMISYYALGVKSFIIDYNYTIFYKLIRFYYLIFDNYNELLVLFCYNLSIVFFISSIYLFDTIRQFFLFYIYILSYFIYI
jgi:hypothetical protein